MCNSTLIGKIRSSINSAASFYISGIRYPLMSNVELTFECPNLRETMMLGTPWFSIRYAAVRRRS